jgi:hypothetical protein
MTLPHGTYALTSAMCTHSRQPVSCFSSEIASSKSRASTGSIVTVSRSRRSTRGASIAPIRSGIASAACSTSAGNASRSPCSRMTISTSTPGSVSSPRTSSTTPWVAVFGPANWVMRATTIWPVVAPPKPSRPTSTSPRTRRSLGVTTPSLPDFSNRPTIRSFACVTIPVTSPAGPALPGCWKMRIDTMSPCMAPCMSAPLTYTSPAGVATNPYPRGLTEMRPVAEFRASKAVKRPFGRSTT